jgi:uncharacterized protein (TIGR03437 family)
LKYQKYIVLICLGLAGGGLYGQQASRQSRLRSSISGHSVVSLAAHVNVRARPEFDRGAVDASMPLPGLQLNFKPSPAQQAALAGLLKDQQNPNSPHYHQWLTPEEFGNRFGLSQGDYDQVSAWLTAEGFTVSAPARARRWISFQGTASLVRKTFRTPIHHYQVNGKLHYANAANPSIPSALAGMVQNVRGLTDFKMKSRLQRNDRPDLNFTNGTHGLAPDDFATIYNLTPLYAAGYDGKNQSVVVVGQSNIRLTDQTLFRTRFNLPVQNLQTILVPGEKDPGQVPGDIDESNLDIQWVGAIARNAKVIFVYANDVAASISYAIDQNLAPVLSASYGNCEQYNLVDLPALQAQAQQANAQGITWLNASGDFGASDCEDGSSILAQTGLAVDSPASTPEVTAIGGTSVQGSPGGKYWASTSTANGASALSYIPEGVWNDTSVAGSLASGGGGNSLIFPKPPWQEGLGVTSGSFRQVPDLSFSASGVFSPYAIYSQGKAAYVGGTSAGTPAVAGIVVILNQYLAAAGLQAQAGLGNINPGLYRLAQNSPDVFHDVTAGNNAQACPAGSPDCTNGTLGFSAGPGYDRATGLGSVDANAFVRAWAKSPATVSSVLPAIDQIPVFQGPSVSGSSTPNTTGDWVFTLTLAEEAGIETTLTGFSINGEAAELNMFAATTIPARGFITSKRVTLTPQQIAAPATVLFNFTGVDAGGQAWSRDLSVPFRGPQTKQVIGGSINAASGQQTYAPGMILSVFGAEFGATAQAATAIPLPSILAGFEAFIDGNPAPLYFVSPGQVNVQIPYETSSGTVKLIVGNPYDSSDPVNLKIAATAPGIFAVNGSVVPFPAVKRGDTTTIFITGEGQVTPSLTTGTTPSSRTATARLPKPAAAIQQVTVGGVGGTIAFIGIPPGLVGVTQVNFVVPASAPLGVQPVVVTIGAASSPPVKVTIVQ